MAMTCKTAYYDLPYINEITKFRVFWDLLGFEHGHNGGEYTRDSIRKQFLESTGWKEQYFW